MRKIVLNTQFYGLLALFSLTAIPLLILFVAVRAPFASRRVTMRRFRRAISWYGWVVARILPYPWIRIRRVGFERLRTLGGPFLFVCNHRSASDPFLLALLPVEGVQAVNIWPLRLPIFGFFAKAAGYLSVREMPVEEFVRRGERLLREGVSLGAFPEGTRARDRRVAAFHGTVFRLALRAPCSVVPVCFSGTERTPPKGSLLLSPATIEMRLLAPIPGAVYRDWSAFRLKNHVRQAIVEALEHDETAKGERGAEA
jgi:1-acyl-sn-glycerol-3-phosphate acyltransferase